MADPIRVTGLREFSQAVRALESGTPKLMRTSMNDAVTLVIEWARPRVPSRSGRARGSIRAASTQTAARVRAGGARARYYPWLDFGGRVGAQRQISRPFFKEGRFLWKGLVVKRQELIDGMESSLTAAARSAGLEVDSG